VFLIVAPGRLRIYLATDEPKVIEEAGRLYPQFVFLTTSHGGRSSGEGERTGPAHTHNLLSDLFHLAKADFFVGTASSQVSRCVTCVACVACAVRVVCGG
jgi:hypothetical protein